MEVDPQNRIHPDGVDREFIMLCSIHNVLTTPAIVSISASLSTVAPTVTIEFEPGNVSVIESDGSVTVNLVKTGYHSNNITVYISITRIDNPGIVKCMYICMLYIYCCIELLCVWLLPVRYTYLSCYIYNLHGIVKN